MIYYIYNNDCIAITLHIHTRVLEIRRIKSEKALSTEEEEKQHVLLLTKFVIDTRQGNQKEG